MVLKWLKGKTTSPSGSKQPAGKGNAPPGAQQQPDGLVENAVALAAGLEMSDAFYPGHDPIDYYGNGGFRFGDMSHQGALMFLPSGIRRWDVSSVEDLDQESFSAVMAEAKDIEILLIGTGQTMVHLDRNALSAMRDKGIKIDVMDTGAAVRTLNILLSEDRAVAAALLPVD